MNGCALFAEPGKGRKRALLGSAKNMNRIISSALTTSALIFGVFLLREEAVAQTAKDLVGTWTLVSLTVEQDGKKNRFLWSQSEGPTDLRP